jgi:hypothetical protein
MERAMGIEPTSEAWGASDLAGTGGPSAKNWILLRADKLVSLKRKLVCEDTAIPFVFAEGKLGGLHACGATFPYIVPLPNTSLTLLFSKPGLKRKDFLEVARLTWAHES